MSSLPALYLIECRQPRQSRNEAAHSCLVLRSRSYNFFSVFVCYFQHITAPVPASPVTPIPRAAGIVTALASDAGWMSGCFQLGFAAPFLALAGTWQDCPVFIWRDTWVSTRAFSLKAVGSLIGFSVRLVAGCVCFNLLLVTARNMQAFGSWQTIWGLVMFWEHSSWWGSDVCPRPSDGNLGSCY